MTELIKIGLYILFIYGFTNLIVYIYKKILNNEYKKLDKNDELP